MSFSSGKLETEKGNYFVVKSVCVISFILFALFCTMSIILNQTFIVPTLLFLIMYIISRLTCRAQSKVVDKLSKEQRKEEHNNE